MSKQNKFLTEKNVSLNSTSRLFIVTVVLVLVTVCTALSQTAVQFKVPITLSVGTATQVLTLGVRGDGPNPPGTIVDNTIGADMDTLLFGKEWTDILLPPTPGPANFDARFVTIPGRESIYPFDLVVGAQRDIRGYDSPAQIDSFKIVIYGAFTESGATTISWPSGLEQYSSSWIIKPERGSDWPITDMITSQSVTIPAGSNKNIIIIRSGFVPEVQK
jgi:hypothetical protein